MLKRFLLIFFVLLTACSKQAEEITVNEEYISPIKDVFLFGELDPNVRAEIKKANGGKDYSNYLFKMLNKNIYMEDLCDINGNTINLTNYDEIVLEVVSIECNHCMKLIKNHLNEMINNEYQLIQYFNVGNTEDIIEFYDSLGIDIPKELIIIPNDEGMYEYVKEYLVCETYPTLVSYVNNKVSFVGTGEYEDTTMDAFYDISFNNRLDKLVDKNGNDLLSILRDIEDVKNDLSIENREKIASIDNDLSTIESTYKVMGSICDYTKISNDKSNIYMNEIDDFNTYKDKNVVLLYTFLRGDEKDDERIDFINSLIDSNDNYEYIVVFVEGLESSSTVYKKINKKFNCPVVSVLGYMPEDFYKIGINQYPTAFFIRKGTFTGAYSNIESIDKFDIALDMFLSEECIALVKNN